MRLLSTVTTVQVCDARDDASSNEVGKKDNDKERKNYIDFTGGPEFYTYSGLYDNDAAWKLSDG